MGFEYKNYVFRLYFCNPILLQSRETLLDNSYLNGCQQNKKMTGSDAGREGDITDDKAIQVETEQMFEGCKVDIISHL